MRPARPQKCLHRVDAWLQPRRGLSVARSDGVRTCLAYAAFSFLRSCLWIVLGEFRNAVDAQTCIYRPASRRLAAAMQ